MEPPDWSFYQGASWCLHSANEKLAFRPTDLCWCRWAVLEAPRTFLLWRVCGQDSGGLLCALAPFYLVRWHLLGVLR